VLESNEIAGAIQIVLELKGLGPIGAVLESNGVAEATQVELELEATQIELELKELEHVQCWNRTRSQRQLRLNCS
jgi:hypothetical protein